MSDDKKELTKIDGEFLDVFKLKTMITFGDETVTELKIREPTAGDYTRLGDPYIMQMNNDKMEIKTDAATTAKYLSACTGYPVSILEQMDIGDFMRANAVVSGFLGSQSGGAQAG